MTHVRVAPMVGVRLDDEDRAVVADLVEALRSPRRPRVSVSDVMRAAVREMHATVTQERVKGEGAR